MDKEKYKYEVDCCCNNVPYEQIMKVIIDNNCKSSDDVRQHLRVANRCKMCKPFIDCWCQIHSEKVNK